MSSDKPVVVKYKGSGGVQLEILTKAGTIESYRQGKTSIDNTLVIEEIFKNASKFQKARTADIKKALGTEDQMEALKLILAKGTFSLTKKELQEKVESRRREIVNYLHKYYHDAAADPVIPHPISRLDGVLDQMKVRIDPYEPVNKQLKPIIKKLSTYLRVKQVGFPEDDELIKVRLV